MDRRAEAGYAARWTTEGNSGEKTVTEAEWLECKNRWVMLNFLKGKASERKLRLFVYAVCLQIGTPLGKDGLSAVAVAERYADGQGEDSDLLVASAWLGSKLSPIDSQYEMDIDEFPFDFGTICPVGEQPGFNSIV